jgi:hypothetical protein
MVNGSEDVITDLGVRSDGTLYVISHTTLYTADPNDGHVTPVGPVTACGMYAVALTFTPDDKLWAADFKGAFCRIDLSGSTANVVQVGTLPSSMAISGDLVAVADGTMYGTAYSLTNSSTANNNSLIKIDPTNAQITMIGPTGFPKLFGVSYFTDPATNKGNVFGFTHDGSGHVITIDPRTGVGTLYGTFMDSTGKPISFAGAGVNSMVMPGIG